MSTGGKAWRHVQEPQSRVLRVPLPKAPSGWSGSLMKAAVVCVPLIAASGMTPGGGGGREQAHNAYLDTLVGAPVVEAGSPTGLPDNPSVIPPAAANDPNLPVTPAGGNLQVLVIDQGDPGTPDLGPAVGAPVAGDTTVPAALSASGIPVRALKAYVAAADAQNAADPTCRISWSLIAGIGRVESNHGRFGGAGMTVDGKIRPPIYGPRLDGSHPGWAVIHDTDGGRLDGDPVFDRAVGPTQFLPATWVAYQRDGDGDGVADPQDIDDAALTTANYLCSTGGDLSTQLGRWNAVMRYNHAASYVELVLALADSYASGKVQPVPTPPPGADTSPPAGSPPATEGTPPGLQPDPQPGKTPSGTFPVPTSTGIRSLPLPTVTGTPGRPTKSPTGKPTTTPTGSPTTSPTGSPTTSPTGSPTTSPTGSPTTSPTGSPTTSPTGSPTTSPTGSPTTSPTGSPTTSPTTSPTGSPTTSPTGSPATSPVGSPAVTPAGSPAVTPAGSPTASPAGPSAATPGVVLIPFPCPTPSPTVSPTGVPLPSPSPTDTTTCTPA